VAFDIPMSIRYQILVPLILVILGLVGICAWTAQDSARLARRAHRRTGAMASFAH